MQRLEGAEMRTAADPSLGVKIIVQIDQGQPAQLELDLGEDLMYRAKNRI